ncbi:hypothetical protein Zm00014a_003961, partial [Zea mays]
TAGVVELWRVEKLKGIKVASTWNQSNLDLSSEEISILVLPYRNFQTSQGICFWRPLAFGYQGKSHVLYCLYMMINVKMNQKKKR